MTTFHNYNPERPEKSNSDIYVKAIVFGILGALALIFLGKSLIFIVKQAIEYWVWVLVGAAGIFFAKKFFFKSDKKKKTTTPQEEYSYD